MLCAYPPCGKEFTPKSTRKQFCTDRCRTAAWNASHIRVKAEELREIRATLAGSLDRLVVMERDTKWLLEQVWQAKAALEKIGNQGPAPTNFP